MTGKTETRREGWSEWRKKGVLLLFLAAGWLFMPVSETRATTLEELKAQLEVLQQKVAELKAQKALEDRQIGRAHV